MIDGLLETDAVIEPATSGGPLLGADGRVVGITSRSARTPGIAVPRERRPRTCSPSSRSATSDPALARHPRPLRAPEGVALIDVHRGRPRRRAPRCRPATSCRSIDGVAVATPRRACSSRSPSGSVGDTVTLHVLRAGAPMEIDVRLEERPATLPAG